MTIRFASTGSVIRTTAVAIAFAAGLTSFAGTGLAYTQEQKTACMPDAFRLCSSEIPSIPGITACMRRQKASLSPACKAVFDKNMTVADKNADR